MGGLVSGRRIAGVPANRHNAAHMAQDHDGAPTNLDAAVVDEAAQRLSEGEVVRVVLPGGRLALCTDLGSVKAAQRGKITPDAVRLDRGKSR